MKADVRAIISDKNGENDRKGWQESEHRVKMIDGGLEEITWKSHLNDIRAEMKHFMIVDLFP